MNLKEMRVATSSWIRNNPFIRTLMFWPKTFSDFARTKKYSRSEESKHMQSLHNSYEGKSCYIIGNGPSLKKEDLIKLSDRHTFCMNFGFKVYGNIDFRPEFYVAADPIFVSNYAQEIISNASAETIFLPFKSKDLFKSGDFRVNKFFINVYGPFTIKKGSLLNDDFSDDASKYLALSYTVTYYAIQLAAYMGFERIYLLGIDHRYGHYFDKNGKLRVNEKSDGKDYADGISSNLVSANQIYSTTHSYEVAEKHSKNRSFKIFNATRGGDLEAFERISFEESLKDSKSLR